MTIRTKVLILLIGLASGLTGTFLWFAQRIFEEDKKAYLFESSWLVSKQVLSQSEVKIERSIETIRSIMYGISPNDFSFNIFADHLFRKSDFLCLQVWQRKEAVAPELVTSLSRIDCSGWRELEEFGDQLKLHIAVKKIETIDEKVLSLTLPIGNRTEEFGQRYVRAYLKTSYFNEIFPESSHHGSVVFLQSQQSLAEKIESQQLTYRSEELIAATQSFEPKLDGVKEVSVGGKQDALVTYIPSRVFPIAIVSALPKHLAFSAIRNLRKQILVLFGISVLVCIAIGILASARLTQTVRLLSFAIRSVSSGNYSLNLAVRGRDEISQLAVAFQKMSHEIARLMEQTREKARMEIELSTAKMVQETLFPPANAQFSGIQISGKFVSATECGGDWWYYWDHPDFFYVCIADATGHGVPAALIASATCSAVSVLRNMGETSLEAMAFAMNKAVSDISHGDRMLTMFLMKVNKSDGIAQYVNCSHHPALVYSRSIESSAKWTEVPHMLRPINSRIGERADSRFESGEWNLQRGDRVLLLTDGATDVVNAAGKALGERRFFRALLDWHRANGAVEPVHAFVEFAVGLAVKQADGHPLIDDVTVLAFEYLPEDVEP